MTAIGVATRAAPETVTPVLLSPPSPNRGRSRSLRPWRSVSPRSGASRAASRGCAWPSACTRSWNARRPRRSGKAATRLTTREKPHPSACRCHLSPVPVTASVDSLCGAGLVRLQWSGVAPLARSWPGCGHLPAPRRSAVASRKSAISVTFPAHGSPPVGCSMSGWDCSAAASLLRAPHPRRRMSRSSMTPRSRATHPS